MANIKSAMKRIEIAERNNLRNKSKKTEIKTVIKKFESLLNEGNVEEAKKALNEIDRKLKKAVSQNVIHKNTASRKISRLTIKLNKAS